jgi:NADH-quinone oxidoreductase subunit C
MEVSEAQQHPLVQKLIAWDPKAVVESSEFRGELTIATPPNCLPQIAEDLRSAPGLEFTFLSDITAVDRFPMEPRFELNYHLLSISMRHTIRLRVKVEGTNPVVATVTSIWPTANWHEREIFDLFGVRFEGHPDLRRLLMPDDWEGYPLRKDYPVEGFR